MTTTVDQLAAAAKALDVALDRHFGSLTKPLSIYPELADLRRAIVAHEAGAGAPTPKPDEGRIDDAVTAVDKVYRRPRNLDLPTYALIADALRPYVVPPRPTPGEVSVPVADLRQIEAWLTHEARGIDPIKIEASRDIARKYLPPAAPPVPEPDAETQQSWRDEARKDPEYARLGSLNFAEAQIRFMSGYVAAKRASFVKGNGGDK